LVTGRLVRTVDLGRQSFRGISPAQDYQSPKDRRSINQRAGFASQESTQRLNRRRVTQIRKNLDCRQSYFRRFVGEALYQVSGGQLVTDAAQITGCFCSLSWRGSNQKLGSRVNYEIGGIIFAVLVHTAPRKLSDRSNPRNSDTPVSSFGQVL
jgi:hypothetical protein